MKTDSFVVGPFQENSYIISSERTKEAFVIDPGEADILLDFIEENKLNVKAIINTHAHIDHVLGVQEIKEAFNVPFHLHKEDEILLQALPQQAAMFGLMISEAPVVDKYIEIGQIFELDDISLKVIHTPGHSPGSVSFYTGKEIFSGDVLFQGSIGRTDLYGGSYDLLMTTIREKLFPLGDDVIVYSGHGPSTTIGREQKYNPFFQE